MQINNIQQNTFKSGLTKQILEREANVRPKQIENYFKHSSYSTSRYDFKNLDLKDNKAYAAAFRMCAEIFKNFARKHHINGLYYTRPQVFPSDIIVLDEVDLSDDCPDGKKDFMNSFHCITSHIFQLDSFIKSKSNDISIGSILVPNIFNTLEQINEISEHNKKTNFHSSGHFLNLFVHEWIHSLFDHYLYMETSGQSNSNYESTYNQYDSKKLNKKENEIVEDILGEYASKYCKHQYGEIIAEAWSKFICDSLDKDGVHFKKDPVEVMKKTPKEFRKILEKVSTIDIYEHNYLTGKDKLSCRKPICFYPAASIK